MLTRLSPWLNRAVRTFQRPTATARPRPAGSRLRVESLEDRLLPATSLLLSGLPSLTTAGTAGNLTVTAQQADGTTNTAYSGTIAFSSSDTQAGLPANYTFVPGDQGVHTFSVTLKTAGTQSVSAADTVSNSVSGSESGITVSPASASSLAVSGFAAPATAGTAGTVTVTAKDAYGNTATGYLGTVHVGSSDAQAVLPADYTFVAADAGVHSFSATLKTAGTQSLAATDDATTSITGSQSGITVNPAAASSLVLSGFPSAITVSVTSTVTVTAQDAYGNTATGYTGTVHFSSSDAQAILPANYAFVSGDAGAHVFSVTLATVGLQSLTVTDTITPSITGTQSSITARAAGSNAWAKPQLVTISFVPDGTQLTSNATSTLFSTFNNKFGSAATWQAAILSAAQSWWQQANVNFEVVSDNGTKGGQGSYQQGDPGMGDIRIGAFNFGNTNLGSSYLAPPVNNYSIAGDINFNTGQSLNIGSTYDLQTVALHEFGHALGLDHVSGSSNIMYAYYTGQKRSLSNTDITNVRAVYGARLPDAYNANPATANTSFAAAASLNTQISPVSLTAVVNNLSINSTSQAEYFTFNAPWGSSSTLKVSVQSTGLSMFTPSLKVYAADQSTLLGSASSTVQYHGVTVSSTISGIAAGQQFYVKVTGVDSSAFSTGAFALTLNFGTGSNPSVTLPNTQVLDGSPLTGGGGIALAALDLYSPFVSFLPPPFRGHSGGWDSPDGTITPGDRTGYPLTPQQADPHHGVTTSDGSPGHGQNGSEGSAAAIEQASLAALRDLVNALFGQANQHGTHS